MIGLFALAIVLAACGTAASTPPLGSTGSSSASTSSAGAASSSPATAGSAVATPSPASLPGASSAFSLLRMATAADPAKPAPDPAAFTDSFPSSAPTVYVVFALRSGLTGQVVCTMTANGVALIQPLTITYAPTNSWGDFKVSPKVKFAAGAYQATLRYVPNGEVATINFTVR